MSGSPDEDTEEEIIIPDFEDCKLELLYDDNDLSQDDDDDDDDDYDEDESQEFYTILKPIRSEDQGLFLQVLENLKNAVYSEDSSETGANKITVSDGSDNNDQVILRNNLSEEPADQHLTYACRLCSFATETEAKIKEHLKNSHPKRRKPKHRKYYPHIAVDENGLTSITVSKLTKSNLVQKITSPNIQIQGSKIYIERSEYCDSCIVDMSSISPQKDKSPVAQAVPNSSESEIARAPVNVPLVMVGKQSNSDESDTFTLVSSEKQMSLKPIAPASPAISIYKCNSCDYYSNNKNYLKQHMDIVHNSLRPYKCPFCDYAGKRSHALREHLIVHSSERPYECNFCNATFRKKGHLTNHIKLHNNSKTLVKCPLCKELVCETKAAVGLTGHLQSVHGTDKLYGCDLCEFIAANEPDIVEHLQDKHLKVNVYKCDKCSFDTTDKSNFENHVKLHNRVIPAISPSSRSDNAAALNLTPIKPVWIKCTECGFTGQDSEVIRQHMIEHLKTESRSKNNDVSPPPKTPVSVVDVDLLSPGQLIQRFIKCNDCNFQASSEAAFQKHLEIHKQTFSAKSIVTDMQMTNSKPEPLLTVNSSTKSDRITEPILIPVSNLIQSNIVKPVPVTSFQSQPTGIPSQFVQVSGMKSKQGIRYLPASNLVTSSNSTSGLVTSSVPASTLVSCSLSTTSIVTSSLSTAGLVTTSQPDKSYVSRTRFTPSNFANTLPLTMIGNNLLKAVPQKIQSHTIMPAEIGQPPVAKQVIPLIQNMDGNSQIELMHQTSKEVLKSLEQSVPKKFSSVEKKAHENDKSAPKLSFLYQSVPAQNSAAKIVLKEIPVPRQVSVSAVPKLPPEITQLNLESDVTTEDNESLKVQPNHEDKLDSLRKSLANVQELIQQQEKIQRQTGTKRAQILDSKGIPQKTDMKNVVYYITPVSKQDTSKSSSSGITHDSTAGRFRCTICGYTCEYQRTIKAHIWKHSGNKDVEYPMFQNGPLSIYEDDRLPKVTSLNTSNELDMVDETPLQDLTKEEACQIKYESVPQIQAVQDTDSSVTDSDDKFSDKPDSSGNLPSFIVYEESKISNVAPALAHLIAARTMVGLRERNKNTKMSGSESEKLEMSIAKSDHEDSRNVQSTSKRCANEDDIADMVPEKRVKVSESVRVTSPINVVVENVQSVSSNSDFTGMQSQQGSPRTVNSKSPEHSDSGVSEMTGCSKVADDCSASSGVFSPLPEGRLVIDDTGQESERVKKSIKKRVNSQENTDNVFNKRGERSADLDWDSEKASRQTEESAVTLLSLLKKGPNYNPACPPRPCSANQQSFDRNSQTSSPGLDDTNSTEDSDISGFKPKSGISSSLLAVIEQLRERSKSDIEEDKPVTPIQTKKPARRRSRRGSLEDNNSAVDIDNVEQFMCEGEIKYRCKLCHYNNESTVLLRQHMRLHKTKQPFECSLCDFIAHSSEALQDHMIQHCKVRLYQCKMCPSTFNYKSQLRAHMRAHNDLDILLCDLCDFETRNVTSLKMHMKTHEKTPAFTCDICKCAFISNLSLQAHKIEGKCNPGSDVSDDTNENASYKCGQCEFVAVSEQELKGHKRGHKLVEQTLKKCPYCEYAAASVEQVQNHISNIHGENKHMKCELCGFVALSIRSLKSHMKRHVNDQKFVQQPLEQYKCNLCGYVCHHLPSLKSHMWRHAANEHYSYEFTNEIINSAIDFDGHTDAQDTTEGDVSAFRTLINDKLKARGIQNLKETAEKNAHAYCWVTFRCCQCGFETINKAELNVHMKTHSDIIRWTLEVSKEQEEEDSEK